MAKAAGKSAAKKSSSSKKRNRKGSDETGQDPPIIIKSGALPKGGGGGGFSMEMDCKSPMDFSFDPTKERPNQYFYPDMTVGAIHEIVITKDGEVVFDDKVSGSVWQISLLEEE